MSDTDCRPGGCQETPDPVMPRCDIALPDGTYTNATVVVEGGCITAVSSGAAPLYAPDLCCEPVQSGGGGDGPCDCPPGEPGQSATVSVGQTHSTAPGTAPNVVNTGTASNAVLEFYIPRGERGEGASGGGCEGITDSTAGIQIEGGCVVGLPINWPPALSFQTSSPTSGVSLNVSAPDPNTGNVVISLDLSSFRSSIENWVTSITSGLQDQIDACCAGGGTPAGDPNMRFVPGYNCPYDGYMGTFQIRFDPSTGTITSIGGNLRYAQIPGDGGFGQTIYIGSSGGSYDFETFSSISAVFIDSHCHAGA